MCINSKLAVLVLASCGIAFGAAMWTFLAGFGFLAAFVIYSFGGAALLMSMAAISVALGARNEAGVAIAHDTMALAN